jgi:hypothetical protein
MLEGEGSVITPYSCKCGIWQYREGEYEIISNPERE